MSIAIDLHTTLQGFVGPSATTGTGCHTSSTRMASPTWLNTASCYWLLDASGTRRQ